MLGGGSGNGNNNCAKHIVRKPKTSSIANGNDVQISHIEPHTGRVHVLTTLPDYAYLECAAIVSNGWFHYVFFDNSNAQYVGSIDLQSSAYKKYHVAIPNVLGQIFNLASMSRMGSELVFSTDSGLVGLVQPILGVVDIIGFIKLGNSKMVLAGSVFLNDNLLTLLSGSASGASNVLAVRGDKGFSYVDVDAGNYTVSLANF